MRFAAIILLGLELSLLGQCALASEQQPEKVDEKSAESQPWKSSVGKLLQTHCNQCHNNKKPEAELSLESITQQPAVQENYIVWQKVAKMLAERQMPPEDQEQPDEATRQSAIELIERELAKFDCGTEKHPGRITIRRLNRAEYNNTVRDLLGVDFEPAADFPSDNVGEGFDNISDILTIPPVLMEKYLAAAQKIVDRTFADPTLAKKIFVHQPSETVRRSEATRLNISDFATLAFRRPVTNSEVNRFQDLHRRARDQGLTDDESMQVVVQAIMCSPNFLFRIEQEPESDSPGGIRELDDFELATRLSYFLWSSMPDQKLFEAARAGKLRGRAEIVQQIRRMLADPKSIALVDNFAGQWLQLRDLSTLTPDPVKYPKFDEPLRGAMLRETQMFFEAVVREDRSILDFLVADFSFVNERLAQHYGITNITGEEFRRISLPDQRRGVLTHASILLLTSNPTRTSPVKRGKWILENILAEPPPPPPANVEELDPNAETLGSLRERMEQHRANESCAVCHKRMDALGFGLENFDGIGAWRDQDGRFNIDASGTLSDGTSFSGPKELVGILKEKKKDEFCRCLASKMLTYALGRGLKSFDRCAIDGIINQISKEEFRFSSLVAAIVTSDPFRYRAGIQE